MTTRKVGDKVRIKSREELYKVLSPDHTIIRVSSTDTTCHWISNMDELCEKEYIIESIGVSPSGTTLYYLYDNGFYMIEDWIETKVRNNPISRKVYRNQIEREDEKWLYLK